MGHKQQLFLLNFQKNRKNLTLYNFDSKKPISDILNQLHIENTTLLVEGGTQTIKKFLALNLWDEARVFTCPQKFLRAFAPIIKALPHHQIQVSNDNLAIYYNEHN